MIAMRFKARLLVAAVCCCVLGPAPASAQEWFKSFRTFSVFAENDALAKWRPETTDESYTQGMRLTWEFGVWRKWAGWVQRKVSPLHADVACTPAHERFDGSCGTISFGLGQTMYSPKNIITTERQLNDQPFAGWLFGTVGFNVRRNRWQTATEFVVGVIGPPSFARNTQSLAHWTWASGSPKPRGWDNQLKGSVHAGATQTYAWHALEKCRQGIAGCSGAANEERVFDLSPRSEAILTTVMVRGSLGAIVRYGRGFPDTVGARIPATASPSTTRERWKRWWALFAAADQRFVVHNAFLSGSYADGGADGWRAAHLIAPRRYVNETSAGAMFGFGMYTISGEGVWRSLEWDPLTAAGPVHRDKRHSYLSLKLSLNTR